MKTAFVLILITATLSGCASMSNRSKTLLSMGLVGGAGATIGAVTAREGERPIFHAGLWGGLSAAVMGVLGLFIFDEQARSSWFEKENALIRNDLDGCKKELSGESLLGNFKLSQEDEMLPPHLRGLIKPTEAQITKVRKWTAVDDDPLTLRSPHIILKLQPSQLKVGVITPDVNLKGE